MWQPMETAPKDGTEFLVAYPVWESGNDSLTPSRYHVMTCHWNGRGWDRGGWMLHETPKHWQPMPEPPPLEPHG